MGNPLVSLVIPAYQAERFLGEALESARAQTYRPLEVLVVDDGSTDGTAAVAARFPEVACFRLGTNRGLPAARNAGIEQTHGRLIAFLDADDVMTPERISVQARFLVEHPRCGCVLARQEVFVEPGATVPPLTATRDRNGAPTAAVSTTMVTRSAILAVGGFDVSYRFGEDMDLLLRLEAAGVGIEVLDQVLIRRRFHGANLSYNTDAMREGLLRTVRRQIQVERSRRRGDPR